MNPATGVGATIGGTVLAISCYSPDDDPPAAQRRPAAGGREGGARGVGGSLERAIAEAGPRLVPAVTEEPEPRRTVPVSAGALRGEHEGASGGGWRGRNHGSPRGRSRA